MLLMCVLFVAYNCTFTIYVITLFFHLLQLVFHFFFFKQKTAYEMRISDWSSDVCSSDLRRPAPAGGAGARAGRRAEGAAARRAARRPRSEAARADEIGRASCRERVCQYV